jgi:hypothetical protein
MSEKTVDISHPVNRPDPRLIYHYKPTKPLIVKSSFMAFCILISIFILRSAPHLVFVISIVVAVTIYSLLRDCSIKIWLDWPDLIYSYRSIFRRIHKVIPSWEIDEISPEITSTWRGHRSERLVMKTGSEILVLIPYYSESDPALRKLMQEVSELPSTRNQAEHEIGLNGRVAAEVNGET